MHKRTAATYANSHALTHRPQRHFQRYYFLVLILLLSGTCALAIKSTIFHLQHQKPKYESLGFPEELVQKNLRQVEGPVKSSDTSNTTAMANVSSSCSYRLRFFKDGTYVYLTAKEDDVRMNREIQHTDTHHRQCWCITKGEDDWYYIKVVGAVNKSPKILSAGAFGIKAALVHNDFQNGKQRWLFSKTSRNRYLIKVRDDVFDEPRYLGVSNLEDDEDVDLFFLDEESHFQQWEILGCKSSGR